LIVISDPGASATVQLFVGRTTEPFTLPLVCLLARERSQNRSSRSTCPC